MLKLFKKAFTLAEVLIVIGIIGVAAALTLPNLNHATGDKETVTKVKKIYSALSEAYGRAEAIYGNADTWFNDLNCEEGNNCSERFAKRMTEFMKISKDCGFNEGCFSTAPDSEEIYDNLEAMLAERHYMVMLPDGMALGFKFSPFGDAGNILGKLEVFVDIDGPNKGKNELSNDLHIFDIGLSEKYNNYFPYLQLVPDQYFLGNDGENNSNEFNTNYGTWWIINFDNMDYLKCFEDLDWEAGITSCK